MKSYSILILLLLANSLYAQDSWQDLGLNGKVKALVKETYTSDNKADKTVELSSLIIYQFNERGLNERQEFQYANPNKNKIFLYAYDNNKNLLQEIYYDHNGILYNETRYSYDNKNNILNEITTNAKGNPIEEKIYSYDKNNALLKVRKSDYGLWTESSYLNDNSGKKIAHFYKAFGMDYGYRYKYNNDNQLIEQTRYKGEKELIETKTYTYDTHKRLIQIATIDASGFLTPQYERYKYNNKGMLIEESSNNAIKTIAYNDKGDKTKVTESGKTVVFNYEYDAHNNWISREALIDGEVQYLIKRIFNYYE